MDLPSHTWARSVLRRDPGLLIPLSSLLKPPSENSVLFKAIYRSLEPVVLILAWEPEHQYPSGRLVFSENYTCMLFHLCGVQVPTLAQRELGRWLLTSWSLRYRCCRAWLVIIVSYRRLLYHIIDFLVINTSTLNDPLMPL